jgi:hypothetical protein
LGFSVSGVRDTSFESLSFLSEQKKSAAVYATALFFAVKRLMLKEIAAGSLSEPVNDYWILI